MAMPTPAQWLGSEHFWRPKAYQMASTCVAIRPAVSASAHFEPTEVFSATRMNEEKRREEPSSTVAHGSISSSARADGASGRGLKDVDGEMFVQLAVGNLTGGGDDSVGLFRREQLQNELNELH